MNGQAPQRRGFALNGIQGAKVVALETLTEFPDVPVKAVEALAQRLLQVQAMALEYFTVLCHGCQGQGATRDGAECASCRGTGRLLRLDPMRQARPEQGFKPIYIADADQVATPAAAPAPAAEDSAEPGPDNVTVRREPRAERRRKKARG